MQENYSVDSWEKVKVIGRGGSSTVYRCVVRESGLSLAVKEIVTDGMTTDQIKGIGGEVDTIKNLSHDNIVRCFGSQQVANKLYIVLEFCGRGSLRKLYQDHGALSEPQAARCVLQILHGLEYLHANGVAHRDVKGANILLTSGGVLKLADFGASKKIETESLVSGLKGTPHWMAPEVIKGTQMSTGWMKADVWSLGCTLVEILSASLPFSEYDNPMTAMYQIASGKIPPLPPGASNEAASFVKDCCAADPEARPSVTALLTHPFLIQCRSLDGNQEYSLESSLFDGVSHARAVTVASKGVAEAGFPVADDIDVLTGEESYVDDDIEAVLSADVNRFMEERKAVGRVSQVGGLSVRTSSFHASDGEVAMVAPPLECEDTPVLHKSRKGIHTMSSNNILRVSDNPLTATTPAAGDSRRPPLQVSTERMSISTMSGGIAQHAGAVVEASVLSSCSRDAAIEDDVMDSVISPRLTSMTVSSTTNTPNVFFGKKRILSGGESLDGDLSRVSTANVMPLRAAAEIHSPAIGELKSNLPVYNHSEALSAPLPKFVLPTSEQVPSAVMFQIGRSDTVHTSHVTPVKRKHRPGKKNAQNHPSAKDYSVEIMSLNSDNSCAPSKHQLKVGTINISGPSAPLSHDNTQTPTTKTLGKVDHAPLLMREYPRNSEAGDASEGTSTEMVITASGGHKRKLKPTPPGSYGGAPHKVSVNNRRNFAVATTSGVVPNSTIDLAKSSALPPIGTNQCLAGLTGKKREKNDSLKAQNLHVENLDNLPRPTAPLSSDKLQYSGELQHAINESATNGITHGSSTDSTTISEACAIAAESNYGKFGQVSVGLPNRRDTDDYHQHHKHRFHRQYKHDDDHRSLRQGSLPKGKLASLKHKSIRSHSAGVVPSDGHPLSNNVTSTSRPQLPVIRKKESLNTDATDDILRTIQTAPAPSRLPPISGAAAGQLGSLTPNDKIIQRVCPIPVHETRYGDMDITY